MIKPYYEEPRITIYHGDCRDILSILPKVDLVLTDPPYGINYHSSSMRKNLDSSIVGDIDTSLRDEVLDWWKGPALVFGSWKAQRPLNTHTRLIWDTKGALGMGNLSIPWKPSDQEIYVIGNGFKGRRDSNILRWAPVQSMAKNGRLHPHQKPVNLIKALLSKCPMETILDPFMGSGTTLRAAKDLRRKAIGIEIEEKYCEIAVKRLRQEVLPL